MPPRWKKLVRVTFTDKESIAVQRVLSRELADMRKLRKGAPDDGTLLPELEPEDTLIGAYRKLVSAS